MMNKVSKLFRDLCRFDIISDDGDPRDAILIRKKTGDYIRLHLEKKESMFFMLNLFLQRNLWKRVNSI